jgi:3-deoxy-D-manno-octulosonate 8-phosphate phosphatase (KDO 8-P phosphatase)
MVTALGRSRLLLTPLELQARARRIRLVLTDCDGVLTDASVYYGPSGDELRRFSVRDGMGVEMLREAGIATAIVSGENAASIRKRAEKLELPFCFLGIRDKAAHLAAILEETGLDVADLAYIGDDRNDLGILGQVGFHGLAGAPRNAISDVRNAVHYVCEAEGGEGAFREFAEWIIDNRRDDLRDLRRSV